MSYYRQLCLSSLCLFSAYAHAQNTAHKPHKSPNIILFLVDDMGWQDTSVPFARDTTHYNRLFHTPNMERLAKRGVLFEEAYAAPVSSPSRCSLLTGSNSVRHRVTNWTLQKDQAPDTQDSQFLPPEWNMNGISPVKGIAHTYYARPLPDIIRALGYRTILCGKAHFGAIGTPAADPLNLGFDINIAGHAAGGPATYLSNRRYGHDSLGKATSLMSVPGLEKYWDSGTFLTEALNQEALHTLDSIKQIDNKPFFLYMSHYAVHVPFDRDSRYYEQYRAEGVGEKDAAYASLVAGMDKSLGDIMDWLERNGERDNTIIIFLSDNGGLAASSYWRDGAIHHHNAPLLSGKGSVYEGGVRVPMIVSYPKVTRPDTRTNARVIVEDLFPTLIEMAGGKVPQNLPQTVDGVSFLPLLNRQIKTQNNRAFVWNYPHNWGLEGPGINFHTAIRQGKWKLIYSYRTGEAKLFDLSKDIGEEHDLSAQYPKELRRLKHLLGQQLRKMGGQRPIDKVSGQVCPWPDEPK